MSSVSYYPSYDVIAPIRAKELWSSEKAEAILLMLKKLMLQYIPEGASILDLCCGTGHLIQLLDKNGYKMTGLDGSETALAHAREKTPHAEFMLADACSFELSSTFHGVISQTAMAMITNLEDLTSVFCNVYSALRENGIFMFNIALEEESSNLPKEQIIAEVQDDYAWYLRYFYQEQEKTSEVKVTAFQLLDGTWQRSDSSWFVKGYTEQEIELALKKAGFTEMNHYNLDQSLGISVGVDQDIFVCRKSAS
ncbi:methyltransferase family protein [Cylindrospermum stagnale PCC 7417]|uniref:Methyltransferase family protein n=1 Tax=Cylindrospermum stagnale PCC 7417 TaxID=56107 RepID=K9WUD0_9NOST|nr:class I SAM-dependent methyltransferase [Cylindrospermum stagnale]AFZ23813.1 methyltransferase family protein [Cylindrospermum stagnale PCC 7417]